MKHTTGPWHRYGVNVKNSDGDTVLVASDPRTPQRTTREAISNANLGAAAPDLLHAARLFAGACAFDEGDTVEVLDWDKLYRAYREACIAAREATNGSLAPDNTEDGNG